MISKLKEEIVILRRKIGLEESIETGFMKYCRFGISFFEQSERIFTEKPLWKLGKNCLVRCPLQSCIFVKWLSNRPIERSAYAYPAENKGLENEKTGQDLSYETLSGDLPRTGLEPAPYCYE